MKHGRGDKMKLGNILISFLLFPWMLTLPSSVSFNFYYITLKPKIMNNHLIFIFIEVDAEVDIVF
jgi:hypothetical protein